MCEKFSDYAESLLKKYVEVSASLYGPQYVTFNVHSLVHLANDTRRHGCSDEISVFPFENKLKILKNLLRESGRLLQQIVNPLEAIEKAKESGTVCFKKHK